MLRSVKELENLRVTLVNGQPCGRIKDVYFDDHSWTIRFIKASLDPARYGHRQVLLVPDQVFCCSPDACQLNLTDVELEECPLDSSYLPVCQQYAIYRSGSPGSLTVRRKLTESNPHLRSAKALFSYSVHFSGEFVGCLGDFVFDDSWAIRYIGIEQLAQRKRLCFHLLPGSIQTISWATQRIQLRELNPVVMQPNPAAAPASAFAAA